MLFYFVTITTHISNIKGKKEEEICSNKDVIYFTVKNKKKGLIGSNLIIIIWSLITLYIKFEIIQISVSLVSRFVFSLHKTS